MNIRTKIISSLFVFSALTSATAWADGGGIYLIARVHKEIFHLCYNKAVYQPNLQPSDFAGIPEADIPYLYFWDYNMAQVTAHVDLEHSSDHGDHSEPIKFKQDFACKDWLPYLSYVYFSDSRGQDYVLKNMQRRFCQEREFDLEKCSLRYKY